jgi:flagellar protein FlgJ
VRYAKTPEEQCSALYACGYATDPDYSSKLISIINSSILKQYDIREEDQPMTSAEKAQFDALVKTVKDQQGLVEQLTDTLKEIQNRDKMSDIPQFARESVDAAMKAKLIDSPYGGSLDFYRFITIMHRKKLF